MFLILFLESDSVIFFTSKLHPLKPINAVVPIFHKVDVEGVGVS